MATIHGTADRPFAGSRFEPFFRGAAPTTHALLRIGAALLFIQHGVQKLFGWLGGFMGEPGATAPLFSLMGLAGVLEVFGGLLILVGLFTPVVALILLVQMVAAYVIAHMPLGGFPIQNEGELALLYALVFAFLMGHGAGPWSMDRLLARRRGGVETAEPGAMSPAEPAAGTAAGTATGRRHWTHRPEREGARPRPSHDPARREE